jgi:hypothetical protein
LKAHAKREHVFRSILVGFPFSLPFGSRMESIFIYNHLLIQLEKKKKKGKKKGEHEASCQILAWSL